MPIQFERPVGAHRDVKELEYVSALLQTGARLRPNATVTAQDVVYYLRSRHGLAADVTYMRSVFLPGLAGALGENADPTLDLVELTCLLLIPHLLREAPKLRKKRSNADGDDFFSRVYEMILRDVVMPAGSSSNSSSEGRPLLTRELLQSILECYGEAENARPEDIDAMMTAARAHESTIFTPEVLARACISDLQHYHTEWEESQTTHFDDVFHGTRLDTSAKGNGENGVLGTMLSAPLSHGEKDDSVTATIEKKSTHMDEARSTVKNIFTFSSIDYVAETFRSAHFSALLWMALVAVYFAFLAQIETIAGHIDCDHFHGEFSCKIVNSITSWLVIFVHLSVIGTAFVVLGSAGNSVYARADLVSTGYLIIGVASILFSCVLPYFFPMSTFFFNTYTEPGAVDKFLNIAVVVLGSVLLAFQFKILLFIVIPRKWYGDLSFLHRFLVPGTVKKESRIKKAARWKTQTMVENAMNLHEKTASAAKSSWHTSKSSVTAYGDVLLRYESTMNDREQVGGILWAYRKMRNGSIYDEEGVWLHARLLASNASQYLVAVVYTIALVAVYYWIFTSSDDEETQVPTVSPAPSINPVVAAADAIQPLLDSFLSVMRPLDDETVDLLWQRADVNGTAAITSDILESISNKTLQKSLSMLDSKTLATLVLWGREILSADSESRSRLLQESSGDDKDDYDIFSGWVVPEPWTFMLAMTIAAIVAILQAVALASVWLPSSISTILQFRSGVIGSLHDVNFKQYRTAPDLTTILLGSTIWGTVISSIYVFALVFLASFFVFWETTRPLVLLLVAQLIGIAVTIGVKTLVLMCLRKMLFKGMYRRDPASSNLMMTVLECWSLGLSIGTVIARLLKLVFVSAFYVGRLDTPIFAEGVGEIGPIPLDSYPMHFRKDLLLHDAHRHPYIERLGTIFMLKLKYGDEFGCAPQSAWRLIVVQALMPWLRRFRVDECGFDEDGKLITFDATYDEESPITRVNDTPEEIEYLRERLALLESENVRLRRSYFRNTQSVVGLDSSEAPSEDFAFFDAVGWCSQREGIGHNS